MVVVVGNGGGLWLKPIIIQIQASAVPWARRTLPASDTLAVYNLPRVRPRHTACQRRCQLHNTAVTPVILILLTYHWETLEEGKKGKEVDRKLKKNKNKIQIL